MRAHKNDRRRQLLASTAACHHGVTNSRQHKAIGYSKHDISHRVRTGELTRMLPNVVRAAGAPKTWEQDVTAVTFWGGEGAAASGPTSARLWGFEGFSGVPIEISITKHKSRDGLYLPSGTPFQIHRVDRHLLQDIVEVRGIPTTSVRRTLLDLCGGKHSRAERTLDTALIKEHISLGQMALFYEQEWTRGRRGIAILRGLILDRLEGKPITQSYLEDLFRAIVFDYSLPVPKAQYPITLLNGKTIHPDFAYPDVMIAIECDSRAWHANRFAGDEDALRDLELGKLGWLVLRFTYAQLRWDPAYVAETVRHHLRNRVND